MVNRNESIGRTKRKEQLLQRNHLAYVSEKYKEEIRERW